MCTVENNDQNKITVLFCIVNLLEVSRKKHFSNFLDFNPPSNQNEVKYFIINVKTKVFL